MLLKTHRLKKLSGLITISLMFVASSLATTQAYANQLIQTGKKSQISVVVDEAKLLKLDDVAEQIIIGNPGIADITVQNAKLLVLTGKSYGLTNIIILNKHGETILNTRISVDDDHSRSVSLHRGSKRASYHCSENSICNAETDMGDDSTHLGKTIGNIGTRKSIANSTSKQADLGNLLSNIGKSQGNDRMERR